VLFLSTILLFHPLIIALDHLKPHLLFQTTHFEFPENSFERLPIMRLFHLLLDFYLFTAVWAGGFAGALERVWLFQAYQIDALNPPDRQTVGFKCRHWEEEKLMGMVISRYCEDGNSGYQACRPPRGANRRCTYAELMYHLGKAPSASLDGWSVTDPATGRLDIQQTAIATYNKYMTNRDTIPDFPPHSAMKGDVYEYNDYIRRLNKVVTDAYVMHKTDANVHLWDDFDATRDQINTARTASHGKPWLIDAARASTHLAGMTVVTQNIGTDPITGNAWETVDWAQTAKQARDDGITDVGKKIKDFRAEFYNAPSGSPREHLMVIKSYKRAKDAANRCRRTG
jgi:hypothetical protein